MRYYLKKYWPANLLAILLLLIVCALQIGNNLLMMQVFQSIIELDLRGFFFWELIMTGAWFLLLWIEGVYKFFQGRAVRAMNNAVRRDMTATLLHKSHGEFHGTDTGEYLSWFTNDVNRIEELAWQPFYQCVACAANALFSAAALLTLHWSLLAAALVNVAVMMLVPQDLSLTFQKGGKYALTGPSGCGKSTLLKLLLGWLPDYSGTIQFDGVDARGFTPEQRRRQMSCIEQNVFLFNTTIRDNITLGEDFTDEQMEKALRNSALMGDLAAMPEGLDTPVGEDGSNLSGGQKQRVAIARALIHDRSILLVDEGTSALDQKNAGIVEESLLSNPELTLILVSHHLSRERKARFTQVYDLPSAAG